MSSEPKENKEPEIKKSLEEEKRDLEAKYQLYNSKKHILQPHSTILVDLFKSVSNRLENDPMITDKLHYKKGKGEKACCIIM